MKIKSKLRDFAFSLILVALASLLGEFVQRFLNPTNLVMIYLLAVVIAANFWGRGASITVAVLSVLVFDFLFVPPRFTFTVEDTQYLLTFAGLLVVGLVISELASQTRKRAMEALNREIQTTALYNLSRDLVSILTLDAAMPIVLSHMKNIVDGNISIHLTEGKAEKTWNSRSERPGIAAKEMTTILVRMKKQNGDLATTASSANGSSPLGVLESEAGTSLIFEIQTAEGRLSPEKRKLVDAMVHQAALAVERIKLLEENRQIELLHEKEKLQTALLNSISHDLKTPLVSITGSLSSLLQTQGKPPASSARQELIENAYEESVRLNRMVDRFLDMAKIESGVLKLNLRLCDIREVIAVSLSELQDKLRGRPVRVQIAKAVGDITADFYWLSKVITNILDNAAKYSPPGSPVDLKAEVKPGRLHVEVRDRGCGIPSEDIERVFDKFYRVKRSPDIQGTGLGLSICRGIVELHGGRIWAESLTDQGTAFMIDIPLQLEFQKHEKPDQR